MLFLLLGALGIAALAMVAKAGASTSAKDLPSTTLQRAAAQNLLKYVRGGGKKSDTIKAYQLQIGAKNTGVADSQTQKKIETILGYKVSWVVAKTTTKKTTTESKLTEAGLPKEDIPPAEKIAAEPKKEVGPLEAILSALAGKTTTQTTTKRTVDAIPATKTATKTATKAAASGDSGDAAKAARELDDYLATKPPTLNALDRTKVKSLQKRMGVTADGVPGPKTKARAGELLLRSVSWPIINAANDLKTYYAVNRGRDKATIAGYQKLMCEITADGVVGPKTKARYKSLTGKDF